MSLHPDSRLTPEIEDELRRVIDAGSADDLAALAHTDPAFQGGGFRASNMAALRARACQLATGAAPVSDALRRQLAARSLNRPLVGLLSTGALADLRHELAARFGGPRLLLAMLVDERAEVRELATRWLRQEPVFVAIDPEAAATRLREALARLLEGAGTEAAAATPVTREAWQDARENLEQQVRDVRVEARRLKGVDDRLARNREQLAACERERDEAQTRATEAESRARAAIREREAAQTELARELRHREERLLAAVETRLATEAASWLAPAHATEVAAAALPGDLLARAAEALARQAATDRHSGNRRILSARREEIAQHLGEVRDALVNALLPLPELAPVERELAAELQRLDGLLNRTAGRSALEEQLAARLACATLAELQTLRALLQQLTTLGVLDAAASARLAAAREQRLRVAGAAVLSLPDAADNDDSPAGILRRALLGQCAAVLLVDGHNVLFGLQGRYLPPQGAAVPTGASRMRLVGDVTRLVGERPTCRAWIVFDGPTRSESTPAHNVRVTYSGGEGENRADAALLDNIRFFRASGGDIPILLVSNDNGLLASARRLGARTLSALEFSAFL